MLLPCFTNITCHLCSYSYLVNSYISSNKSALGLLPCLFKSQMVDNLMISMNLKIVDCLQRESEIVKIYLKLKKWQTYKQLKCRSRRPPLSCLTQQSTSNSSGGWTGQCKSFPHPGGTLMTPVLCRACTSYPNSCCEFTGTTLLACAEASILQHSFPGPSLNVPSPPSSFTFLEHWKGATEVTFMGEYSTGAYFF